MNNITMRLGFLLSLLILCFVAKGQHQVSGKITTLPGNEPAIGATIIIKGSNEGLITDISGVYSITVPDDNTILLIRYTGYEDVEIEVGTRTNIDIMLKESISQLDE